MIPALHVALGATVGEATGSPTLAVALGPALHLAADAVPHRDTDTRGFHITSASLAIAALYARRGLRDAATLGAIASAAPDIEHLIRLPQPRGSKLFHGRRGWHRSGRLSPATQLLLTAILLARLLTQPLPRGPLGDARTPTSGATRPEG